MQIMTKSRRLLDKYVEAVATGRSTFDDAVAGLAGEQARTKPLAPEDEEAFRAWLAMFLREALRAKGLLSRNVRAATPLEQAAAQSFARITAEVLGRPAPPVN
jgi:hypothetical protein